MIMKGKDEESSLREQEVLHLRKEDSCIFIEASTISPKLLVAEAKLLFDKLKLLKEAKSTF